MSKEMAWDGVEAAIFSYSLRTRGLGGTLEYVQTLHRALARAEEEGILDESSERYDRMEKIIRESST